nr:putative SAWADEE domain-containing protein [Tanacetum cinerariifolium]
MSEKEVLMRIRVRSLPVLEDDCTRINSGDCVVSQNSEKGFFDAEVEKLTVVNDFELDLDLHDLLEKQIEGIRSSTRN